MSTTAQIASLEGHPEPRTRTRLLRRRWRWFAGTTLVAVAAAGVFSALQPRIYEATAEVVVLPVVTPTGPAPQTPAMGTEKSLVLSGLVAGSVAQRLGMPVERLVDAATVTVPPQTQTMAITCALGDPQIAAACAQGLGEAYVEYKDTQPIQTLPERGRIMSPAVVPPSPSVPNVWLNLLAGLIVGLVLGAGVALLADRLDGRCRRPEDLERRGLRVLGVVPPPSGDGEGRDTARAYGATAARLRAAARPASAPEGSAGTTGPVVAVTALETDGGPARAVARGLASALASAGDRVALVYADTAGIAQDAPGGRPGLLDVLAGRAGLDDVETPTAHPHLTTVPLGRRPGARISLRDWSPTAAALAARYDAVVVAADPVLATANGLTVAQGSSAVLAVADARGTRGEAVEELVAERDELGLALVGGVLVREPRGRTRRAPGADWSRWTDETTPAAGDEPAADATTPDDLTPEAPDTTAPDEPSRPEGEPMVVATPRTRDANGTGARPISSA